MRVRTLQKAGAASLVFDLRNNGGGVLEDALNCIDLLCPEGTLAYAEDKDGDRTLLGSSDFGKRGRAAHGLRGE